MRSLARHHDQTTKSVRLRAQWTAAKLACCLGVPLCLRKMASPRQFSWLGSALVSGVINLVLNAPLGWAIVKPGATIPLWGAPGIALDMLLMAFGLAFGTALVVTPQTRRQLSRGQLLAPPLSANLHELLSRWPRSTFQRAVNLGVLSVLIFVPVPLLALWLFDVDGVDRAVFTALKGAFSFVEGALVTPIIAVAAMVGQPLAAATQAQDQLPLT